MHSIEVGLTRSNRPRECRVCHREIPAGETLVKITSTRKSKASTSKTTSYCCMECDVKISRESEGKA